MNRVLSLLLGTILQSIKLLKIKYLLFSVYPLLLLYSLLDFLFNQIQQFIIA